MSSGRRLLAVLLAGLAAGALGLGPGRAPALARGPESAHAAATTQLTRRYPLGTRTLCCRTRTRAGGARGRSPGRARQPARRGRRAHAGPPPAGGRAPDGADGGGGGGGGGGIPLPLIEVVAGLVVVLGLFCFRDELLRVGAEEGDEPGDREPGRRR
jgi:hypothetical protein